MTKKLVSIVLPCYNGSRFLRESVDSILAQTYKDFELIIVDDCSSDATPDIIAEYVARDCRVRAIRHQKNQKLPAALNTGLYAAAGEYLTWTSDDNIYKPNAIEHLVEILSTNSEIDVIYGNESIINEQGAVIPKSNAIASICEPELIPVLSCVGAYFMFRREVFFSVNGYEPEWFLVEDWQFWLKAYNAGFRFYKTEANNYYYRDNGGSLSVKRAMEVQASCLKLSLKNLAENSQKYDPTVVMRAYLKCVGFAYRMNDKQKGMECLSMAESVNPNALSHLKVEIVNWLKE